MAFERTWEAVAPKAFTADGTSEGLITVADTAGFYVKQAVYISASSLPDLSLQVKRVLSSTQLLVGLNNNIIQGGRGVDLSAYAVSLGARIGAQEQPKNNIPDKDHYSAIYASDPIVADRVIQVDQYGNAYNDNNPIPVKFDGTIEASEVNVIGQNGNIVEPNSDGSINVNVVNSVPSNENHRAVYAEQSNVGSGVTTTIATYTVPVGTTAYLQKVLVSGENVGRYDVVVNNNPVATKRTWWGNFNVDFDLSFQNNNGYRLPAGAIVKITILHNSPSTATFDATIQVVEIT